MQRRLLFVIIICFMASCERVSDSTPSAINVEIVSTDAGFQLLRGGEPYVIKGAGMGLDDIERFAAHGGNSIRNWTTKSADQSVQSLLDSAYANGVTVALCLPMKAERHGFDYDDADAVAGQLAAFRNDVLKYRDHPALLFWIIGNELNHSFTNRAVYDAVNDVAAMIHGLDPNHPTTTTISEAGPDLLMEIASRTPELDFLSLQLYGSLFGLHETLEEIDLDKPLMVTEWGSIGYWEMETTTWGTPVEMNSSQKAAVFMRGYQEILAPLDGRLIGSYVFLWGQKQERTPTWFGMFTETGESTEVVDVMRFLWTGAWPGNRAPKVRSMLLDGKSARQSVTLVAGESYQAIFDIEDHEDDPLRYRWEVKAESDSTLAGGDYEEPISNVAVAFSNAAAATTAFTAPAPGRYRLFAYAYDDHAHAAHANIPFLVESPAEE